MRNHFIKTLSELIRENRDIYLITGDLGFSVFENLMESYPHQFINVGVAEQNMIGVASGLAKEGKIPFVYSIANFPIMRCLEQIRNDICYHHLNVKIVSVGAGYSYGSLGYTHHGVEDIAIMRAMPGMKVIAPGDPVETRLATKSIAEDGGPCYLRLGKSGEPPVHEVDPVFSIGKAIILRNGADITLISTGSILDEVVKASRLLEKDGVSVNVASMHTLKPIDYTFIQTAVDSKLIVTVEEHSSIGGLGSAVSEILAATGVFSTPIIMLNAGSTITKQIGGQNWFRKRIGLDAESIYRTVRERLSGIR
ncbi:MAG: transketolase C-terminal domain-containing protein [Candidatus Poseidoniia archaeon]|jgi:transketolase|nr:transketolase C-terminal domain-containing protein [Candidatus Poseidoniia archaeon]|tara:strand:- start:833 stop:1759 length:927 start_codon:yes stop_codon:yes gene_type:complete